LLRIRAKMTTDPEEETGTGAGTGDQARRAGVDMEAETDGMIEMAAGEKIERIDGEMIEVTDGEMIEMIDGEMIEMTDGEMIEIAAGTDPDPDPDPDRLHGKEGCEINKRPFDMALAAPWMRGVHVACGWWE
jgi:hypothetical protein